MKNNFFLVLTVCVLFTLLLSCTKPNNSDQEKTSGGIDFAALQKQLNENLEWQLPQKPTQKVFLETVKNTTALLSSCQLKENETKPICKMEEQAKYHLILGDLNFLLENYETALEEYKNVILSRYDAYEQENKELQKQLEINGAEKQKIGEAAHLNAHEIFYKAFTSLKSYIHYAEISRAERRFAKALKEAKKDDEIDAALKRAKITFDKSIQFRKDFENLKQKLKKQVQELSGEFQSHKDSYLKHIESWKMMVNLYKI